MTPETIENMVATMGFPIVCVIALAFFIWHIWKQSNEQNEKREEKLYVIIDKAQEQNERLSQTNSEFVSVLDSYKHDIQEIKTDVIEIKNKIEER